MNKQKFVELLRNPINPQPEQLTDLDGLVKDFPYFQSAHVLSAKISYQLKDRRTRQRVSSAAVYSTDRVLLKKYMTDRLVFIGEKTEIKEVEKKNF